MRARPSHRVVLVTGLALALAACGGSNDSAVVRVGAADAQLVLPLGADTSKLGIFAVAEADLPVPLVRAREVLDQHLVLARTVRLAPEGMLVVGGELVVTLDKPAGVVALWSDRYGHFETLEVTQRSGQVSVPIRQLGIVTFFRPFPGIELLGTTGLLARGASRVLFDVACASWLDPTTPKVKALAATMKLENGTIVINPPLVIEPRIDETYHRLRADEIAARGSADRMNASILLGSVLAANGHPVRLVGGTARFTRNNVTHKGHHQWVEATIDGQTYFVDVLTSDVPRLVLLEAATKDLVLGVHRTCAP